MGYFGLHITRLFLQDIPNIINVVHLECHAFEGNVQVFMVPNLRLLSAIDYRYWYFVSDYCFIIEISLKQKRKEEKHNSNA